MPTAIRPDAASAGEAPTAVSPFTTTAKVLAKPTKEDSRPAASACREKSRRMGRSLAGLLRARQARSECSRTRGRRNDVEGGPVMSRFPELKPEQWSPEQKRVAD